MSLNRRSDEFFHIQVGFFWRSVTQQNGFIGKLNMLGVGINFGIYGNSFDAQFFAGAHDAYGDLAAIGDEDFIKHYFSITPVILFLSGSSSPLSIHNQRGVQMPT